MIMPNPPKVSVSSMRSVVITLLPVLAALLAMAALLVLAGVYATFPGDEAALREIRQWRGGWPDSAALAFSAIGAGGIGLGAAGIPWIPVVAVAGLASVKRWADALFLSAAVIAPVVNLGLKELAARPRPDAALALVQETGYSFPSGHAVFAAAFFGALIVLLGRWRCLDGRPMLRRAAQGALLLLILAVGASRVWLGVHWPSDVTGGFLFGAFYLAAPVAVRRMAEAKRRRGNRLNQVGLTQLATKSPPPQGEG